jgi:hypothetical protein
MNPFMNFIWIMVFKLWKFKSISFGLCKEFDCDTMMVYWNNNLVHKNKNMSKIFKSNNFGDHFNPL